MRDHVLIYVNGRRLCLTGPDVFLSLSDFLRDRLGITGTKIVCSEGDCGSCSVLCGRAGDGELVYHVIDSCIQFLFQLDGTHIVSVEGLNRDSHLNPVQKAMVRCHGSQCGFCTPGFVVAMTGLLEGQHQLDEVCLRNGLTGNLCRCTGYSPIIEAGCTMESGRHERLNQIYPPKPILRDFAKHAADTVCVDTANANCMRRFFSPTTVDAAVRRLAAHPLAKVVAGGTDVGVQLNKGQIAPEEFLDLNRVTELAKLARSNGSVVAGAGVTWTQLQQFYCDLLPAFHEILSVFGSPQIRNVGTLGGNIANASPIADSLPFLFVMESELQLQGPGGVRMMNINQFYRGYKQTELQPGEIITRVRIPLPAENQTVRLYRVARRRDLDIATLTAAILIDLNEDVIQRARIALGAVAPTVVRAFQTESFLSGRRLTLETMKQAGEIAASEISPISDVRGLEDYRYQLTRNLLIKFYYEAKCG